MPDLTVGIADPVSGDIEAVCGAIKGVCEVLCTPPGQALLEQAVKDSVAAKATLREAWSAVTAFFKGAA